MADTEGRDQLKDQVKEARICTCETGFQFFLFKKKAGQSVAMVLQSTHPSHDDAGSSRRRTGKCQSNPHTHVVVGHHAITLSFFFLLFSVYVLSMIHVIPPTPLRLLVRPTTDRQQTDSRPTEHLSHIPKKLKKKKITSTIIMMLKFRLTVNYISKKDFISVTSVWTTEA